MSHPMTLAAPNVPDQKPSESSGRHHFGESPSVPSAEHHPSGTWRHFEAVGNSPRPPREFPTWRNLGANRTRQLEHLMYELVNRDRADLANALKTNGRASPLRWNDRLAAVARAHALGMLNRGYFGHEDSRGGSVATRVEAAGLE